MILSLVAAAAIAGPQIVEVRDENAPVSSCAVFFNVGEVNQREDGALDALVSLWRKGTQLFTPVQIALKLNAGFPAHRIDRMPGYIVIQLSGDADAAKIMPSISASFFLSDPTEDRERVKEVLASKPPVSTGWQAALCPLQPGIVPSRMQAIQAAFAHFADPNKAVIAVGGNFPKYEAEKLIKSELAGWSRLRTTESLLSYPSKPRGSSESKVHTVDLNLPPIRPDSPELATAYLACVAMGAGKSSVLTQFLRNEQELSYRQEAFLWGTSEGLRPRIIFASTHDLTMERLAELRKGLKSSLDKWTERDLTRFRAITNSIQQGTFPEGVLWLTPRGTLPSNIAGETLYQGYCQMFGQPGTYEQLFSKTREVTLQQLKDFASKWVESGSLSWLRPAAK